MHKGNVSNCIKADIFLSFHFLVLSDECEFISV